MADYWWIALGYPSFEVGKNGFPRTGQIVKYYRERKKDHIGKPYTQSALAHVLRISEQCMRDIENRDLAMNYERRQFLSEFLAIPPLLLGIRTLAEIHTLVEQAGTTTVVSTPARTGIKLVVDIKEYREKLVSSWKTDNRSTAYNALADTHVRIDALYRELPHITDAAPFHELLCDYHQFVANLLRDRQMYDEALDQLDKALLFAELLDSDERTALVLYSRGYISHSANDFDAALDDLSKAQQYADHLPDYLTGPLCMLMGEASAKGNTTGKQREALSLIDSGGKRARAHEGKASPYFIDFSLDRYHLTKGSALIALGKHRDALDELALVNASSPLLRRNAHKEILYAQAYARSGNYEQSVSAAESALLIAQQVGSPIYTARVEKIVHQLQKSPYKNSPDVARLAYSLRKK